MEEEKENWKRDWKRTGERIAGLEKRLKRKKRMLEWKSWRIGRGTAKQTEFRIFELNFFTRKHLQYLYSKVFV